jgi:phosphoglycolate phosphatase
MITSYQAVFFDLDGTLCDTALDFTLAINRLLADHQQPSLSLSQVRQEVSNGAMSLIRLAFPTVVNEQHLLLLRNQMIAYYQQQICWHTQLYPGLDKLLSQLQTKQIPWGIITNKPIGLTQQIINELNLSYAPCVVLGGDSLAQTKPHPAPLLHAAQSCELAAEHCVYIGDHVRDIEAARAAHMPSIAVSYGYLCANENPMHWQANYVVDTPFQLMHCLGLTP